MGGQGRCERRSEAFVKIKKKYYFFFGGGGGGRRVWSGRGGVRVEVRVGEERGGLVSLGGIRVDVNREVKFL